ncbi:MAG: glycosyltransferase family 2 protein [Coleofasciculaceae cyanobacterium SM2_1_6]|nr:glycosyltransferase family 2 protein [Coleofasciculaceae cyanobacterium SM2_1_6]
MSLLPNPLISVIIPVYNGEQTIQETITSLLDQTYPHWELIVINDGSSDRTLEILAEILAPHPSIAHKIISYPQTGVCASRNRGASFAQGEFLAFLDADDLWSPDKLDQQLQSLLNLNEVTNQPPKTADLSLTKSSLAETPATTSRKRAAIAYSWTDYINEAGEFLYPGSHARHQGDVYQYFTAGKFFGKWLQCLDLCPSFSGGGRV